MQEPTLKNLQGTWERSLAERKGDGGGDEEEEEGEGGQTYS